MSVVLADVLLKKVGGGEEKGSVALSGKLVGLFFSAGQRCPPCERFTPKLKEFYEQTKGEFEVVYVPRDDSEEEMMEYIKEHGGWYYLPYNDPEVFVLRKKYAITSIPNLIVIKASGDVIEEDGRHDVEDHGIQALARWKMRASQPQQEGEDVLAKPNELPLEGITSLKVDK